jgi:hypothetical protein
MASPRKTGTRLSRATHPRGRMAGNKRAAGAHGLIARDYRAMGRARLRAQEAARLATRIFSAATGYAQNL